MSLSARIHADRSAKRKRQASRPAPRQQTIINPAWGYGRLQITLAKAGRTDTDQRDVDELTEGPLVQLERLRTGTLDPTGFVEISEACAAACELANDLYKHATEASKPLLLQFRDPIMACGPALDGLATRWQKTDKWVASAAELNALREVIGGSGIYEQLIAVADRGAVCRALCAAAEQIRRQLKVSGV